MSSWSIADWVSLAMALSITIIVAVQKNRHPKGSDERLRLRLFRIGLVCMVWSYGGGGTGYVLAGTSILLGILVALKGRLTRGILLIAGSIYLQVMSFLIPLKCVY